MEVATEINTKAKKKRKSIYGRWKIHDLFVLKLIYLFVIESVFGEVCCSYCPVG